MVEKVPRKKIDVFFAEYMACHQHPSNLLINWVCIPLVLFSVLGLLWSIPFPHLAFLGKYNGFVNWASFFIAVSGYYYYRLSPVLSYMTILLVFMLSLLVVQFEKWEMAGGLALWLSSMIILFIAVTGLVIGQKIEGKPLAFKDIVKLMLISPICLLRILAIKMGLKSY